MIKTYEIASGKTKKSKLELARLNLAMAEIESGKDIERNKKFVEHQMQLLEDLGCEVREYHPSLSQQRVNPANKKQINIRLDAVSQALLEEMIKKQKADGMHQVNKTLVIEKAIFMFAREVLGREKTSEIINKNYIDELGIWS